MAFFALVLKLRQLFKKKSIVKRCLVANCLMLYAIKVVSNC